MRPYSSFNRGHHYILTVVDVLSKYAWAVPLKSKGGSETANALAEIIRTGNYKWVDELPRLVSYYNARKHRTIGMEKVLRRKGDRVYVKWLGFDGSHNSWIHKNNVV
ncbi:hypothetical protein ALC57_08566 [Trachymyrmex cornetzi]|uniref:Chromo domain-containing protein n=1 Tax=Trachymyrmex cornetzi TaxID=471704 RepID=A0A151J6X9_9HYME|nr:hypothetical protein ALC57_08566 [Trachymyrmex cornetzi]